MFTSTPRPTPADMVIVTPPTIRVVQRFKINLQTSPPPITSSDLTMNSRPPTPSVTQCASPPPSSLNSSSTSESADLRRRLKNSKLSVKRAKERIKQLRSKTKLANKELRRTRRRLANLNMTGMAIYFIVNYNWEFFKILVLQDIQHLCIHDRKKELAWYLYQGICWHLDIVILNAVSICVLMCCLIYYSFTTGSHQKKKTREVFDRCTGICSESALLLIYGVQSCTGGVQFASPTHTQTMECRCWCLPWVDWSLLLFSKIICFYTQQASLTHLNVRWNVH